MNKQCGSEWLGPGDRAGEGLEVGSTQVTLSPGLMAPAEAAGSAVAGAEGAGAGAGAVRRPVGAGHSSTSHPNPSRSCHH